MFHVSRSNNSGPHGVIKRIRQGIDVVMATVAEKRQVKENKKEKVNKIMSRNIQDSCLAPPQRRSPYRGVTR